MSDSPSKTPAFAPDGPPSHCHVTLLDGPPSVTFWACPGTSVSGLTMIHDRPNPATEVDLCLAPERLMVVGRATADCPVPYLDPAYAPTPLLPGGDQCVLRGDATSDNWVSRAHFTLRGAAGGGVVFTNGVPKLGGGLRPPLNGTKMLAPYKRWLDPGEEVFIGLGESVAVRLPNRCVLQLKAG